MNYITLNGKKSSFVQGLLIQSLPPITKPLIRTQTDVIDGRDGDIVTKLGYAAYDKTISIGLYGNYNVDEVISYFDSEGIVVFSNEPDKYYRYQITQQIDFNRLIRFKTANVILHCQPFKYSLTDKSLSFSSSPLKVFNSGNTFSKPTITITGTGTITLTLNGNQVLVIELGNEGYITIDCENMNAQKDGVLKNRLVTGDYESCVLKAGENAVSVAGTITEITFENYSRWI